ncbi:type II secretion system F family protein [Candidatus Woesearchaeota archaeon]|nr:type II secretion system F family protein [Candidatus Woesearchaeota archaeon]
MPKVLKPLFMILPYHIGKKISRRFIGLSNILSRFSPGIQYDLKETDFDTDAREYLVLSCINAKIYSFIFFVFSFVLLYSVRDFPIKSSLAYSFAIAIFIFLMIYFTLVNYPKIMSGKKGEAIEKNLIFALKDLSIQIASGVPTYDSFVNVSRSNYGQVSSEFEKIARLVNSGMPLAKALEESAIKLRSEYYKKTMWQLINTMRAGASLKGALKIIMDELASDQRSRIKSYAQELNLWSLIYLLFAVAIPTIGLTLIIILSNFAAAGITSGTVISFIVLTFIIQLIIIGFIKSRRPITNL